jgi:hypothetical protein
MNHIPTGTPFTNCTYEHCDLPGVCKGQGFCHHPKIGERGATVGKELIEQLAKKHGKQKACVMRPNGMGQQMLLDGYDFTTWELEAFAKAYQAAAPIDNVAEAEVCDEYIDTEAVADARKIWRALNDLSFDCFAGIGLRSPSIQVYNDTFKLMDSYRSTYGALIPDTQAKKGE